MKNKKRFGIILLNSVTTQLYIVRRMNYALWNRVNNINSKDSMFFVHYPGIDLFLEFPKGVREKKETGLNCAIREFFEETGILIDLNTVEIVTEICQKFVGNNGKPYTVIYYVMNKDIRYSRDTVVQSIENPTVLSDSFNVLVLTKWAFIREFFISSNLLAISSALDKIFEVG